MAAVESLLRNRYWILRHGKSIPNATGLSSFHLWFLSFLLSNSSNAKSSVFMIHLQENGILENFKFIIYLEENGVLEKYKLADEGVEQARMAGDLFLKFTMTALHENDIPLANVRICYSPFSRTKLTAQVVASVLNISLEGPQGKVVDDLRERFFGPSFELQSHDRYPEVWAADEKDPFTAPEEGGESVSDVVSRLTKALVSIDSEFKECAVLIVSHGDPLQILQTILMAAKEHKDSPAHDLPSRVSAIKTASTLSQHRKYALDTAELRPVP